MNRRSGELRSRTTRPTVLLFHSPLLRREGLDGYWVRSFPVTGGEHYRFEAFRKVTNVACPRRSALVKLKWRDGRDQQVPFHGPVVADYLRGGTAWATPEYPTDKQTDANGWTEVSDTYRAPPKATQAVVELHLQWAPGGKVVWSNVSLTGTEPPPGRTVRLAAVHFQPRGGKTPAGNCRLFGPLIKDAARQRADLVVLPETLTYYGTGRTPAEVAEPIPGPSTEYFGRLAENHDLYIVAGLYERVDHLVYNVAVLIGPEGTVVGKYRKVTLPTGEVDRGVAPGTDYPVFETRFGKVGMMVCYDGFFPEVARELTNRTSCAASECSGRRAPFHRTRGGVLRASAIYVLRTMAFGGGSNRLASVGL